MRRADIPWLIGGLALGLLIAWGAARQTGFASDSFNLGRLTGNVVGGVLAAFVVGRIVQRFAGKR